MLSRGTAICERKKRETSLSPKRLATAVVDSMAFRQRCNLEEGPILDPSFVGHYWRVGKWPMRWAAYWTASKMRKLGVPPRGRTLDIGCGPGWLVWFLASYFPEMQFVALDASEPMIRQARLCGGPRGAGGRVRFLVGDGCRLPFGSGQFDLVISGATLHHIADPVALFDEIDRVLAEEGHVIVSDLNRAVPRLLWPFVLLADRLEKRSRPADAKDLNEGIENSYYAAYTPEELREFLARSSLGRRVRLYPRFFQNWIQTPHGRNHRPREGRRPADGGRDRR